MDLRPLLNLTRNFIWQLREDPSLPENLRTTMTHAAGAGGGESSGPPAGGFVTSKSASLHQQRRPLLTRSGIPAVQLEQHVPLLSSSISLFNPATISVPTTTTTPTATIALNQQWGPPSKIDAFQPPILPPILSPEVLLKPGNQFETALSPSYPVAQPSATWSPSESDMAKFNLGNDYNADPRDILPTTIPTSGQSFLQRSSSYVQRFSQWAPQAIATTVNSATASLSKTPPLQKVLSQNSISQLSAFLPRSLFSAVSLPIFSQQQPLLQQEHHPPHQQQQQQHYYNQAPPQSTSSYNSNISVVFDMES